MWSLTLSTGGDREEVRRARRQQGRGQRGRVGSGTPSSEILLWSALGLSLTLGTMVVS